MLSLNDQQTEICLFKSDLEEIEHDLIAQGSAIPSLDTENEQKYQDTMSALREARSLDIETERLKQENVRLTAKRMHQRRQIEEIARALEEARERRHRLDHELQQVEIETENEMYFRLFNLRYKKRRYEDSLSELADKFRKSRPFYLIRYVHKNEEEMKNGLNRTHEIVNQLEIEESHKRSVVNDLKHELSCLQSDVPEDIMSIIGKTELENTLKALVAEKESLCAERDLLLKK